MKSLSILILLIAPFSAVIGHSQQDDDKCVYTLYVKTGSIIKGGTDSNISLSLGGSDGNFVYVRDLRSWGIMEAVHDYYEIGNLDVFSGRGPCVKTPVCRLRLASDGSGEHHGWYCEYVEVTTTGPLKDCTQTSFKVDQWLATDAPPYQLTADVDECSYSGESVKRRIKKKFVVGRRRRPIITA